MRNNLKCLKIYISQLSALRVYSVNTSKFGTVLIFNQLSDIMLYMQYVFFCSNGKVTITYVITSGSHSNYYFSLCIDTEAVCLNNFSMWQTELL